jgi:hypothetical protein
MLAWRWLTVSGLLCLVLVAGCGDDGGAGGGGGETSGTESSSDSTGTGDPAGSLVFITRATFNGALGGLSGADAACAEAASAAGLSGTFVAWMSSSTENAIDRIEENGPWFDLAGTEIFSSKEHFATSPLSGLWLDEDGESLPSERIWTATNYGGVYAAALVGEPPCAEWTSASMANQARIGQIGSSDDAGWTGFAATTCDQQARLLCVEQ